jgi:hypothetical protein
MGWLRLNATAEIKHPLVSVALPGLGVLGGPGPRACALG